MSYEISKETFTETLIKASASDISLVFFSENKEDNAGVTALTEENSDTLKVFLVNKSWTADQIYQITSKLEKITIDGDNAIHVSPETRMTGPIKLVNSSVLASNLVLNDVTLLYSTINGQINSSLISQINHSYIYGSTIWVSANSIDYSMVHNIEASETNFACSVVKSGNNFDVFDAPVPEKNRELGRIRNSVVSDSQIFVKGDATVNITEKKIRGIFVMLSSGVWDGDHFSINADVALMDGNNKVIFSEEKKYNLGVWEDNFVNKEKNRFLKIMNQKKLELFEYYFDSLAFRK